MLKIYTAGSYGFSKNVIESHMLRTRVFKEKMGWDVTVEEGLEIDQFDRPDTVYVSSYHEGQISGCCRILRCHRNYMIKEIWPQYLNTISIPDRQDIAELSRFASCIKNQSRVVKSKAVSWITAELFYGVTLYCMQAAVKCIFALHDIKVEKVAHKIGCIPIAQSHYDDIEGISCSVGGYNTDPVMQANLLMHLGHTSPVIEYADDIREHFIYPITEIMNLEEKGTEKCIQS